MVQSWIRQALRASGVAILVPAAIVAAIALSVVDGGGSARSLGQVLTGPAAPPAEASPPPPEHTRRDVRIRGLTPHSHVRIRGLTPHSHGPRRTPVTTLPDRRPSRVPPSAAPAPSPTASPAQQPPSAPPPSAPTPNPIHDTGTQVAETVRPLPVAGPVAANAVEAVVDLVDPPM